MSDIQSNYPRNSLFVSGYVDLDSLKRSANIGRIALLFIATLTTIFQIFPKILKFEDEPSLLVLFAALGVGLSLILAGIAALGTTMFWVTRAHSAVCSLRGITPRISSKTLGFLSGIPYLMFFAPLCYALDFLVIRSASLEIPTMRWYSQLSKSKIVNFFAFAIIIDAALVAYDTIMEYIVKAPSILDSSNFDFIHLAIFWAAIILGIIIAKMVNRNIESLVSTQEPK
jgi:Na+-transporting NADH:ubiquinone oxidoreductase subunit NqrE